MKISNLLIILLSLAVFACNSGKKQSEETSKDEQVVEEPSMSLEKKWETDTILTTVESVIFDDERNILYTANISGQPDAKDGVGFISKVDLDGNVVEAQWVSGLNAPKGMAIVGNSLFVTDIDAIVEIDIESGEVANTYPVEGAEFLNDMTSDTEGNVYASDSGVGKLILLKEGEITLLNDTISPPNGLFAEGSKLITALWNDQKLVSVDLETMEMTEIASGIENPDGVEAVGNGGYLVSSWNGKVHYISPEGEVTVLLDTTEEEISAADIEYIPEQNLLLVPTFFRNSVVAYELVM